MLPGQARQPEFDAWEVWEVSSHLYMSTTEDESKEESAEYGLIFKRFKKNKVEIASAITKPFPFLMSLRDHDFISEEKFQISRKKCENPDAVRNEVYDILCDLQKDFSLSLLEVIFSPTHLKAYPDLNETVKIFRDVSNNHRTLHRINGRHTEERPGLPEVVREEGSSSHERMLDGQEPQDDLSSSPLRPQAEMAPLSKARLTKNMKEGPHAKWKKDAWL
ncbi:C130026I21Rik [Phodopus roborovskii]|uniref:C130026I21Rik protein n=1 Tax=Phodopus roborovskii TaxID=109678 RepID=A0AAU9ZGT8_PHORO|nr:C130026I21Rik [Phodopus roborovskii]